MLGDRLRNLAAQNPGAITEIIRPQPVFANGQQRGYRVYPGRNREQFTKLGLMPGDLVTGDQRHAARRPGAWHGDPAVHERVDATST